MRLGVRRFVLVCVVAASALAVLVPGGSAGPRAVKFTFEVVPGPGQVTYGENIAYRAKISNTSGSTLTHVIFRMTPPSANGMAAELQESTCPQNGGKGLTVQYSNGTSEWTCDFGNLPAWTDSQQAQRTLAVVWQVRPLTGDADCLACLGTNARVSVKEGINDQTNPNDIFQPENLKPDEPLLADLLASDSDTSGNSKSAGGYETEVCSDLSGPGSLRTKQKLDAVLNKISTKVCITQQIPTDANDLGLATTIHEGVHGANPGFAELETSDVCVAALGTNCGKFGEYTPQVFDADAPLVVVLRIPDAALLKGHTITNVWHNYDPDPNSPTYNPSPLSLCGSSAVPLNGCLVEKPTLSKGGANDRFWTITVKTLTNGWFTGG
jgi:hypothetical protein